MSYVYVGTELFKRLDIASAMEGKARMIPAEPVAGVVARGDAELGFQQISELLPIPGADLVGPLPQDHDLLGCPHQGRQGTRPRQGTHRFPCFSCSGPRTREIRHGADRTHAIEISGGTEKPGPFLRTTAPSIFSPSNVGRRTGFDNASAG